MKRIICCNPVPVVIENGNIYAHGIHAGVIIPEPDGCTVDLHGAIAVHLRNLHKVSRWLKRNVPTHFPTVRDWQLAHRNEPTIKAQDLLDDILDGRDEVPPRQCEMCPNIIDDRDKEQCETGLCSECLSVCKEK